jgi:hypothetical protein
MRKARLKRRKGIKNQRKKVVKLLNSYYLWEGASINYISTLYIHKTLH